MAIFTAASPSYADVSAAIAAASPGDTVLVPAGTATWANQLVITKGIFLIGAGIGKTNILSRYPAPSGNDVLDQRNYLIAHQPASPALNQPLRISGFSIDLNHSCYGIMLVNKTLSPVNKIRIDHNRIENANIGSALPWSGVLVHVYGTVYGVVDSNEFENGYMRCNGLDETTWNNITFSYGTADNMYFEDNVFTSPDTMFFYGEMGGRYCARRNTFDGAASLNGLYPFADMHGNQPNAHLATMGAEIYENEIRGGTKGVNLLDQRGGKAVVYGNLITTTASAGSVFIKAREEYHDSIMPPASSPISGQPQHVSDAYYWSNLRNGTTLVTAYVAGTVDYGGSKGLVPQENREFWQQEGDFDGTTGIGVGPLSARPTTCVKGVGYWATDTQTLYRAKETNVWEVYYRPYTYPHPLRNESASPMLTVTSPNGGENWTVGAAKSITWFTTGTVGNVKIEYSMDGGSTYATIAASVANSGSYAWTVPSTVSANCRVRVSEATNGTPSDVSNAVFSIAAQVATPTITLTSPNGGESWTAGTSHSITWTTSGTVGNVKIEYSTDGGIVYATIIASAANSGNYTWTVPNTPASNCLVRISQASNGTPLDISNVAFTIAAPPATLTVTSPNGGESWTSGTSQSITWTTSGTVGNVKIEYSADGGATYAAIASSTANTGSFSWAVLDTPSTNCLIRVSQASNGSPSDASNAAFTIASPPSPALKVTSPNGGEKWTAGTSRSIAWTASNVSGNVSLELYKGESLAASLASAPAAGGSWLWSIPATFPTGKDYKIRVSQGTIEDASDNVYEIAIKDTTRKAIGLSKKNLTFGAVQTTSSAPIQAATNPMAAQVNPVTSTQTVLISNIGDGGNLNWTAASSQSWLSVAPIQGTTFLSVTVNSAGLSAGTWNGAITIEDPEASNSPQTIPVSLNIYAGGASSAPFGSFDTPSDGAMDLQGSIPVTGWAIDDIEVVKVEIWRDPTSGETADPNALVFMGNAVMISGCRPDIEAAYPSYPFNDRAGWGYMLLSNVLPNGGNGYYRLHAYAYDAEGHGFAMGSKVFVCDNANSVRPFGTIDSPEMGATISGSSYVSFGWALTPRPKTVPFDGSTIWVWVDGVPVGHPVYNNYRADIAAFFPGLANSLGAVGFFYLDTSRYSDGLHSIGWSVADDSGASSGVGSRWFYISNSGSSAPVALGQAVVSEPRSWPLVPPIEPPPSRESLRLREGLNPGAPARLIGPSPDGVFDIELYESGRVELRLGEAGDWKALRILDGTVGPLPFGSSFDPAAGIFRWMPGPGFSGVYGFAFSNSSGFSEEDAILVRVTVRSKLF